MSRNEGPAHRLMLVLFGCALLLRLAVPAGWMPETGADGFRIALCNSAPGSRAPDAAQALLNAALPDRPDDHKASGTDQPCAFAGLGAAIAQPDLVPPIVAPMFAFVPPLPVARATIVPGRGLAAPPPPATGPPTFA